MGRLGARGLGFDGPPWAGCSSRRRASGPAAGRRTWAGARTRAVASSYLQAVKSLHRDILGPLTPGSRFRICVRSQCLRPRAVHGRLGRAAAARAIAPWLLASRANAVVRAYVAGALGDRPER